MCPASRESVPIPQDVLHLGLWHHRRGRTTASSPPPTSPKRVVIRLIGSRVFPSQTRFRPVEGLRRVGWWGGAVCVWGVVKRVHSSERRLVCHYRLVCAPTPASHDPCVWGVVRVENVAAGGKLSGPRVSFCGRTHTPELLPILSWQTCSTALCRHCDPPRILPYHALKYFMCRNVPAHVALHAVFFR